MTWNSGLRLGSRSGWTASTNFWKGNCLCANAPHQGLTLTPHQITASRVVGQARRDRQRVEQHADDRRQFRFITQEHRRADRDVLLPRQAMEQDFERRQEADEQRATGSARRLAHCRGHIGGEMKRHVAALEPLNRRTGPIDGQFERGEPVRNGFLPRRLLVLPAGRRQPDCVAKRRNRDTEPRVPPVAVGVPRHKPRNRRRSLAASPPVSRHP